MTLLLRPMYHSDIDQVTAIDRLVFSMPWPATSYAYEVKESPYSHLVILEDTERNVTRPQESIWPWKSLARRLVGDHSSNHSSHQILSYGGMWKIMEEAHISTIASHPKWQGRGYGELVLASMIRRAIRLGAGYIVLEVRVGNTIAQNLYRKYDFVVFDTKKRYYHDNDEDAYDMRLDLYDKAVLTRFQRHYEAIKTRHTVVDEFTEAPNAHSKNNDEFSG